MILCSTRNFFLVAKGFSQEYEIDYEETFAPVAKMTVVRTLISFIVVHQWPLFHLDAKNAFLNVYLNAEVLNSSLCSYEPLQTIVTQIGCHSLFLFVILLLGWFFYDIYSRYDHHWF